jgi:segregation and condensation protein A
MIERTVPWWRRALSFALGTIRSGFGLFRRDGNREANEAVATTTVAAHPSEEQEQEIEELSAEAWMTSPPFASEPLQVREPVAQELEPAAVFESAPEIGSGELVATQIEPAINETAAEIGFAEPTVVEPTAIETVEPPSTTVAADPFPMGEPDQSAEPDRVPQPDVIAVEAAADNESTAAISEEPFVEVRASNIEGEIPGDAESAESSAPSILDRPAETTEPARAASAEALPESAGIATEAAPEEKTVPNLQVSEEEKASPDGTEIPLSQPEPALVAESPLQEIAAVNREPAPEEDAPQSSASALESDSAQTPETVVSEVVTEPTKFPAEAAPEAAAEHLPDPAGEAAPVEASVPEPVDEQAEIAGPESAPVAAGGPVAAPPVPQQSVPEPPPIPAPDPLPTAEPAPLAGPAPAPLPAPTPLDAAPTLPFAEKPAARTTAEKVAAALKAREARGEDADQSPFSVLVNQVYDGPLDLLLDLIRKQDIDIYDIPIAKITAQFLAYVDQLRASDMDVAGEFIYTAALLIHIKSKMLLPRAPAGPDDAAEDPRRELVERLLEHERFKNAAQMLLERQMLEAATWSNPGVREFKADSEAEPEIAADTTDLVRVFSSILERARNRPIINVEEDSVTVGQMIQFLARRLTMEDRPVALRRMLSHTNSERALIAMFLALLELVRLQAILLRQDRHFSEIFIKKHTGFDALMNQGLAEARDDWR